MVICFAFQGAEGPIGKLVSSDYRIQFPGNNYLDLNLSNLKLELVYIAGYCLNFALKRRTTMCYFFEVVAVRSICPYFAC